MAEQIQANDASKSLAAALSYLLPVVQFFYQLLPNTLSKIFPDKEIFIVASVITLITSYLIMIWYKQAPYIRFTLQSGKQKKYKKYINELNKLPEDQKKSLESVTPPFYFTSANLGLFLTPVIFLLGFVFIFLIPIETTNYISFIRVVSYSLVIILTVFISTIYYEEQIKAGNYKELEKKKITNAISLAIEHNSISELPTVRLISSWISQRFPITFNIRVAVGDEEYVITTDSRVVSLISAVKLKPPEKKTESINEKS